MVKIRVPATSANIGVGFDCLGLALKKYAYFDFSWSEKLEITGCLPAFQTPDNLVYQAYLYTMGQLGKSVRPLSLKITSEIPHERGLGSSATCVVGGVLGAYALTETPFEWEEILKIATEIEGHPDNVAPAILGGLVASYLGEERIFTQTYPVHSSFKFVSFIPDFTTSTKEAREVLPQKIQLKEAVTNQSQLLFALQAFGEGDATLLKMVMKDRLHEPYRQLLIHDYESVRQIALDNGAICLFISGSGPTLIGVYQNEVKIRQLKEKCQQLKSSWECHIVDIDQEGVKVC